MTQLIRIHFTTDESQTISIFLDFLNTHENEKYDIASSIRNGLTEEQWKKVLNYLNNGHAIAYPNNDSSITRHDLTDIKEKIEKQVSN